MKSFVFYNPTKIYFGKDREKEIGSICKEYGYQRVLILYGSSSAVKSGLLARVEESLQKEGIVTAKEGGIVPNPVISRTREIIIAAKAFQPDMILAVGGGSTIDTAKAVSYGCLVDHDVWDFYAKKATVEKWLPVGTILTIAAAGSEMSDSAVQTNDTLPSPEKKGTNGVFNRCVFAVLNPELTYTLPKFQIGAGACDIFMHTAERYFVRKDCTGNYASDAIAEAVMRNIMHFGPIGVENPDNYEAMSEIMWCSTLSHNDITGLGLNANAGRGGDWAVHQLGQAMSALYNSNHGASLAAVWGSWARYVCGENPERFAQYGRNVLGLVGPTALVVAEAIAKTEKWFRTLGMPTDLNELLEDKVPKVTDAVIAEIADVCSWHETRTIGNIKTLDVEDMKKIYEAAR